MSGSFIGGSQIASSFHEHLIEKYVDSRKLYTNSDSSIPKSSHSKDKSQTKASILIVADDLFDVLTVCELIKQQFGLICNTASTSSDVLFLVEKRIQLFMEDKALPYTVIFIDCSS